MYLFAAGILEFSRGDKAAARMWFDSSLSIPRPLHIEENFANTIKVRGFLNKYDLRYEDALADFSDAYEIYSRCHNNLRAKIDILAASAEVQMEQGVEPIDVLETVEKAIKLYEENEDQFLEWRDSYNIYTSYSSVLSAAGQFGKADRAGQKALALVNKHDDEFRSAIVHSAIAGQLFYAERFAKSREHAMSGYLAFEKISKRSHMADALDLLIKIDSELESHESALGFSIQLAAVRDSLFQESQVHEIKRLRQSQAQDKTLSELAVAQARGRALIAEQSSGRLTLWGIVATLGFFVLVALVLIYRLRARRRTHAILEKLVASRTFELQEHAKSLEEKNIELERFAFIASHDLKTPLRNILSFLNLADRRMSSEARAEIGEFLDISASYARQMSHTVCDVLEFSKVESNSRLSASTQEIRFIADQAVKISRAEFEDRNPLITIKGNAEVFCSKDHVEQILLRLIHNSLKFNESAVPMVNISIDRTSKEFIELVVEDNGIGIEAEYHQEVFGLFKRLNLQENYPGTGLGLSLARKLAHRMNGEVSLRESNIGEGSTFVLSLPSLTQPTSRARKVGTVLEASKEEE